MEPCGHGLSEHCASHWDLAFPRVYFCFLKTQVEVLAEVVNVCGVVQSTREAAWRSLWVSVLGKGMLCRLPCSGRALGLRGGRGVR